MPGFHVDVTSAVSTPLPLDSEALDELLPVYEWWQDLPQTDGLASRHDIRPEQLRRMLGRISLIDVLAPIGAARCYRYRLFGSTLAQLHGLNRQGTYLDDLTPEIYRSMVWRDYDECRRQKTPRLSDCLLTGGGGKRHYLRLLVPFSGSEAGSDVSLLLSATAFLDAQARDLQTTNYFYSVAESAKVE